MKTATGKPPRKSRRARATEPPPPFNKELRHTVKHTKAYLTTSVPTVYKLIKAGKLEAFKEGRRTYITGRSIAALCLPPV
jgi:excisionase family DNA binding protein